jgi:hypothetical protein
MPERYQSSANTSFRYWIRGIPAKALDSGNRAATAVLETPEGLRRQAQMEKSIRNQLPMLVGQAASWRIATRATTARPTSECECPRPRAREVTS